jgi:hypothetical protein
LTSNVAKVHILPSEPASGPSDSPAMSLSIDRLLNQSKIGSPLLAVMLSKNISDHPVVIPMAQASNDQVGSTYKVTARDELGASPAESTYGTAAGNENYTAPAPTVPAQPGEYLCLLPGESWRDTIDLSKVYNLNHAGRYTFQVQRWDPQSKTWIKSDAVSANIAK